MSIEGYISQIDDYLRKRLDAEEMRAFEAALEAQPELKEEVKARLKILMAIRQKGLMMDQETTTEAPAIQESSKVQAMHLIPWIIAASILFLVVTAILLLINRQPRTEELIASYYFAPSPKLKVRGGEMPDEPSFSETYLYAAYTGKDFESVIEGAPKVLADSLSKEKRSWLHLLVGIAFLETGELDSAEVYIKGANVHPNQQSWYQAMVSLHADQTETLQTQLKAIASDSLHIYQPQAVRLLQEWD